MITLCIRYTLNANKLAEFVGLDIGRIELDRLCEICNRFSYDSPCVTLEDLQ